MLDHEEALRKVLAPLGPLPAERVGLLEAEGRVLAEDVFARWDLPPEANAAMDGFALRAADAPGPTALRVVDTVRAGARAERPVGPGEAVRIMTGAPIPPGADAVIMQEKTRLEGDRVHLEEGVKPGSHVRPRGDDVRAGERVVPAGARVGPAEIAAAAAHGRTLLAVHRRPRVAVISSGDELVEPDVPPEGGRIVNSNGWAVAAACRAAGADAVVLGTAPDTPQAIGALVDAAAGFDVVVTTGGVSVGAFDYVHEVLEARGLESVFWKVAIKPGKPVRYGLLGGRPYFGLPGNPVSALTTFFTFVRPALLRLAGHEDVRPPRLLARLAGPAPAARGRTHLVWAGLSRTADGWVATPHLRQGSHRIGAAVGGDALLPVPPDALLPEGAEVEVWVARLPGQP